jgi:hypothetical protein
MKRKISCLYQESNPDSSAVQRVALSLYRLSYPGSFSVLDVCRFRSPIALLGWKNPNTHWSPEKVLKWWTTYTAIPLEGRRTTPSPFPTTLLGLPCSLLCGLFYDAVIIESNGRITDEERIGRPGRKR